MNPTSNLPPLTDAEKAIARSVGRHHDLCLVLGVMGLLFIVLAMGAALYGLLYILQTGLVPPATNPVWWLLSLGLVGGGFLILWRPRMTAEMEAMAAELDRRYRLRNGPWAP